MKTKRSLSLLLCVVMLVSTLVFPAYADSTGVSVTFAAQKDGAFIFTPQSIEVKDGIAEEYGYTVKDGITSPTFLDALVAVHKAKYGGAFTKESAKDYLDVNSGGWILKSFQSADSCGFTVNSSSAALSNEQIIKNGDTLEYYFYMDTTTWSDVYTFFDAYKKTVKTGESFDLTLSKVTYDPSTYAPVITPIDGTDENNAITINTVNSDGSISEQLDAVIDKDGKISLKFDSEGTYTVTAQGFAETGSIVAPFCVVTAEKAETAPDYESAVKIAYDEFSTKNKYTASNTPLVFPLEYNSVTYTNLVSYLKAWTLDKTGFEPEIEYKFTPSATAYPDWRSGEPIQYVPNPFESDGEAVPNYFSDNKPMSKMFTAVKFKIGTAESANIATLWAKTTSLERNDEEIVDYVASNLPFARIKGNNNSEDEIVQTIGELSNGRVGALPTADKLYTKSSAVISWKLENISGKSDALTLKNNKITVSRPEIGEDNAVFKLAATVTSANDSSITKDVVYTLTVPAYEAVYIPVQVTSGANLTIKNVDEKYIVKQENAPEGYDLYLCALHTAANGAKQDYTYTAELENYITKSGTISVTGETPSENVVISLTASSGDDTKLGTLEFLAPEIKDFNFDKDTTEYNVEINSAQSVKIAGLPAVNGADVKITSYYSSLANANKGTLNTKGTALNAKGVNCYLPDAPGVSVIKITVTAPSGSVQEQKTREYTINITKKSDTKPLTGLVITALSTENGKADSRADEEKLAPLFVSGDNAGTYYYTVNYFRNQITVKPTAKGADIKVNGETVASGKVSNPINLEVGNNEIKIEVTLGGNTETYTVVVRRKAKLVITDVKLDNGYLSSLDNGRTGSCSFANNADKINVTYITNEPCDITITAGDKVYTGTSGEPIEIDIDGEDSIIPITKISHTVDGVLEEQNYVISFRRLAATSPNAVESYLPAPGQFVNQTPYRNPDVVISSSGSVVTLGAFGGYAVYRYDDPIANDSKNPYGIDFIIYGNAFKNDDGTTSSGAAEPGAVMVSKDGVNWYELAGAKYYSADTRRNISVTYTNGDETFTSASDTAWTSSDGESGIMPKNDYHKQPYYPDPSFYGKYQNGIGKNDSYTSKTVTFTGTIIDPGFYPFGYADSHSKNENFSAGTAVNPYVKNHEYKYNGDGFDISWAVDENGNRVELDEISYIKIYNPTLSYGTSTGEKSPEISAIARTKANTEDAGVSSPLSSLYINGKEVTLEDGKFTYTVDAENAETLEIAPTAKIADANIYVSDTRVNSGEKCKITSAAKTRIIVQDGEKEPVIYILGFENIPTESDNSSLSSIEISPDGISLSPDSENKLAYAVSNNTATVRITPKTAGRKATAEISGKSLENAVTLNNGEESAVIDLSVGENVFDIKVKSENGKNEKTYTFTITRKSASSSTPSSNEITVSFTLTGDVIHYNKDTDRYTGNHKKPVWIKTQNVVIPKNSTLKYITELMLNNAKIDFVTSGVYISYINGIGEFDNGKNSGWMYRVNDVISNVGYAAKKLSDGDAIEWFYTDDYTTEKNYEKWDDPKPSSSKSNTAENGKTDKSDTKTPENNKGFDENTFADVKKDDWYFEAVKYVYNKGIIKGTDKGFEPNTDMSRAMLVTVLWRMENSPVVNFAMKFNDANDGWYTEAIRWAASEGIVSGISEDTFGTDEPITREMLTTILYRYAQKKNIDVSSGENTNILSYSDAESISEYAVSAMQWAVGEGIIKGESETLIAPDGKALRAQCAALIMRFCEKYSK